MTADDWVKVISATAGALAIVLSAIGVLWVKIHEYRKEVNGRMTELLDVTRSAAEARGRARRKADRPESMPGAKP
jgi:hypothetical protein